MTDTLHDRWYSREYPVLVEIARRLDDGAPIVDSGDVANALDGFDHEAVTAAFDALAPGYIEAKLTKAAGGHVVIAMAVRLTERGRRATGLWPRENEAADALVELLTQAADTVEDEDDAGALLRAGRLLKSVPGNVIGDVTAAFIRQQTGLG